MNPTQEQLTADEQRRENIHRILDHHDAYCREKEINPKEMDRLKMRESMWEFANGAGIPEAHFNQAYQHQISEWNGTPSKFLTPIFNQTPHTMTTTKRVAPLLPPEVTRAQTKKSDPDEPTVTRSPGTVEPYIPPFQK